LTGVTPLVLDNLTSGFNITLNVTLIPTFCDMIGFTVDEVRDLTVSSLSHLNPDINGILEQMTMLYNGYRFSLLTELNVFNSGMVLYYLINYSRTNFPPTTLLDPNILSDYSKIQAIAAIAITNNKTGGLKEVEKAIEKRQAILASISSGNMQKTYLTQIFSLNNFSDSDFLSVMFYKGYLTIAYYKNKIVTLKIPNIVLMDIMDNYFTDIVLPKVLGIHATLYEKAMRRLSDEGKTDLLVQAITAAIDEMSRRNFSNFDEPRIRMIAFLIGRFYEGFYASDDQKADAGFADLVFMQGYEPVKFYSAIEFKYIKPPATEEALRKKWDDALAQLREYNESREFDLMNKTVNLKLWIIIFSVSTCLVNQEIDLTKESIEMDVLPDVHLVKRRTPKL
jgi:hypothetical protein